MNLKTFGMIMLSAALTWGCQAPKTFTEKEITLIPVPQKKQLGESSFRFDKNTVFVVENEVQKAIAEQLIVKFEKAAGWKPSVQVGGQVTGKAVRFITDQSLFEEGYTLQVTENQIDIQASSGAGFFYATQTLRQLLPSAIEKVQPSGKTKWDVPIVTISDNPAFKWRGFMLDVSRHFFPKEYVLDLIDYLALHKINTLHLHLVDDQGWRIEIKKYPKLTEIGSWRVDQEDKHWNSRKKNEQGDKATYGGYYTQDDIREMVAYAQSRFINVVPEIEMPAHVTSALAAYPQFSCTGGPFMVPSGGVWPITDIYCAGNDSTFLFLQDVLTEVMDLFPSKYIHIGGDEATKTEWEKCPKCKKRIKSEKLKDVQELQSYFIKRMEKFINAKERVLIGWDEILEGGLAPQATVMSWRGVKGGIEAAKQGHNVVMTPGSPCYFDHYQGQMEQEPLAIGGYNPLNKVYAFNPVPEELTAEEAKHVLGGQANLWTEYVPTKEHAMYMTFPRIAALAEVLWSPREQLNWDDFARRIQLFFDRYETMGVNYAKSVFQVSAKTTLDPEKKQLSVILSCELPGIEIRYTTDGTEPTASSLKYESPVLISQSCTLQAISFDHGKPKGKVMSQVFKLNKATVKPVRYQFPANKYYPGAGDLNLVNSIRGTKNHSDGQWQGWNGQNLDVVVDLEKEEKIERVTAGTLQNAGSWIFLPKKVEVFTSVDGQNFQKAGETLNDVDPLIGEILLKEFEIKTNGIQARYIKVVAQCAECPKGHSGAGNPGWLFVDEITVE